MCGTGFERLRANRRHNHLVQRQPRNSRLSDGNVTTMRRIQGASEKGNAHSGIVSRPLYSGATSMPTAYIALGSNLGNRAETLLAAMDRLASLGAIIARSSIFETEPVGYRDQPAFLNAVVTVETALDPLPLLQALL